MDIFLDEIPCDGTLDVEISTRGEVLNRLFEGGLERDYRFDSPVVGSFRLSKRKETVLVGITLSGRLKLSCSRCLDEFEYPLEDSNLLTLFPCEEELDREIALDGEEIEKVYYSGGSLDLDEIMREQLALILPVNPVCDEDC